MRRTQQPDNSGFTVAEILVAFVVLMTSLAVMTQLALSLKTSAAVSGERRLAGSVAQGAFERLRNQPVEDIIVSDARQTPLPPEASGLDEAVLTVSVEPWQEEATLLHLKATLKWRSRRGDLLEVVRQGLVRKTYAE